MIKRKIKGLVKYLGIYALLIASIIGLRLLHGVQVDWNYYITITVVIFSFLIALSFVKPEHIERILPKNSSISSMVVLMMRFRYLATQKIVNIKHNQEMRGARFGKLSQFKNYLSLLVPSIIVLLKWAENVSESIRIRGGN